METGVTLPDEKNSRACKFDEDLQFFSLSIHPGLRLTWPSGIPWIAESIYFHDNSQPNGTIPTADVYQVVGDGLALLQEKKLLDDASAKMLLFEDCNYRRGSCVGGNYVLRGNLRTLCFYVRQTCPNRFVFVCRIW